MTAVVRRGDRPCAGAESGQRAAAPGDALPGDAGHQCSPAGFRRPV